jgi:nitrate reductase NapAB chaperone NapD
MQPVYDGLVDIGMFWCYMTGICIIAASTGTIEYLWWALSKGRHITRDIFENVNETTVIYDRNDRPCYVNITYERSSINDFLQSIDEEINRSGILPENFKESCPGENALSLYEGEIKPFAENDSIYSWKMCPVVRNKKYFGRIFVFNDITEYKKLLEQLDNQNRQLKEALDAQRRYAGVVKRLGAEIERERIMGLVNGIAAEYLEQLKESIRTMEKYAAGNTAKLVCVFEAENNRMINITRETISRIRNTVKSLHSAI